MAAEVWIVGSAGFIGRHLRRRMLARTDVSAIVCIDRDSGDEPLGEAELLLTTQLGHAPDQKELFAELEPRAPDCRAVIFLAAYYDFSNRPHPGYDEVYAGLRAFVPWVLARVPPGTPLVYASSMAAVAATEPGVPLTPESPRSATWMYPAQKRRCEDFLESLPETHPIVELVLAGVYSDDCELVPLFHSLELMRTGRLEGLFYPADPDRGLTYVHVDDASRAFAAVLDARLPAGVHRYLVGEGAALSQRALMDVASRTWRGRPWRPLRVPRWLAALGARLLARWAALRGGRAFFQPWMMQFAGEHFEFDLAATEADLGWKPHHSIAQELPAIVKRAAADPDRWLRINRRRPW